MGLVFLHPPALARSGKKEHGLTIMSPNELVFSLSWVLFYNLAADDRSLTPLLLLSSLRSSPSVRVGSPTNRINMCEYTSSKTQV